MSNSFSLPFSWTARRWTAKKPFLLIRPETRISRVKVVRSSSAASTRRPTTTIWGDTSSNLGKSSRPWCWRTPRQGTVAALASSHSRRRKEPTNVWVIETSFSRKRRSTVDPVYPRAPFKIKGTTMAPTTMAKRIRPMPLRKTNCHPKVPTKKRKGT